MFGHEEMSRSLSSGRLDSRSDSFGEDMLLPLMFSCFNA